ncbi:MAG: rRNA adenine N-6-methyltransferase family protein [Acidimicrobiales bacterium]
MPAPQPRWGWHQLSKQRALRLVDDAGIRRGDLVLDIGAGTGAITAPLVQRGAKVIAIELHPIRAEELRQRFAHEHVTVVRADAADLRLPKRPFRVVANPPFAVSVAILRRLTSPHSRLLRADIIVPRHTAERWIYGNPPGAGRWRKEFNCSFGALLSRSSLTPPPPHDVAVLVIRKVGFRSPG